MTTIVRFTRFDPQPAQLAALREAFGSDVRVITRYVEFPKEPREAVALFDRLVQELGADVVEAVLPLDLLAAVLRFSQFVKRGGRVIRAVMKRQVDAAGNATFTFQHYEEVLAVNVETPPAQPRQGVRRVLRLTRHAALPEQVEALRQLYGEGVEIIEVSETLPEEPRAAVARFDELAAEAGAQVVEAVLPVGLLSAVLRFSRFVRDGGAIIRAVMRREGETVHFDHYVDVVKVEVNTRSLEVPQ